MKLTRERLKQIIKEELREMTFQEGGGDEEPNYSAVPSGQEKRDTRDPSVKQLEDSFSQTELNNAINGQNSEQTIEDIYNSLTDEEKKDTQLRARPIIPLKNWKNKLRSEYANLYLEKNKGAQYPVLLMFAEKLKQNTPVQERKKR